MSGVDLADQVRDVAAQVTERLSAAARAQEREPTAPEHRAQVRRVARQVLQERASSALARGQPVLDGPTEEAVLHQVLARVGGLGPLEELLADEQIENINLTGTAVWVRYADGRREQRPPIVRTSDELIALVRRIAAEAPMGERRFDAAAPILDMSLADGSRLNAVMDVSAQPMVSIRRHRYRTTSLGELRRLGTLDAVLVALLRAAVRSRRNIVITGGTGAGKTTLLRALATEFSPHERVITVEDIPELGLERDETAHPDAGALYARPPNTEGQGEITVADQVRAALRMSPDRIIVGETRGAETIPLLNAMSQSNDGSVTTLHASSSGGAFTKLGAYAALSDRLALESTCLLVAAAVHLVVHVDATPEGERRVTSVREVVGVDGAQVLSNEIYRHENGGTVAAAPPSPATVQALGRGGFDVAQLMVAPASNGRWR
ncbi:CpaF family protein [Nocardiopsis nanhaiensis]